MSVRILHVGSFKGNIGDNINHGGFYRKLGSCISGFEIKQFEIRETFWGNTSFDESFVELCNGVDLVVIGGGNFFELWVEKSQTGCSIDLPVDRLNRIEVPVIFNALGVDPGQGYTAETVERFRSFIEGCIEKKDLMLTVRNDGALENIKDHVGHEYVGSFRKIADGGFYFERTNDYVYPELSTTKKNLLIQIAGDMPSVRYDEEKGYLNEQGFLDEIVLFVEAASKDYHIIFCPHIYHDITLINRVLASLNDRVRRNFVSVAPCVQGNVAAEYIHGLYGSTDINITMRFHACVMSLSQGRKTIGLVNYLQIENLFKEIEKPELTVDARVRGFGNALLKQVAVLEDCDVDYFYPRDYLNEQERHYDSYISDISDMLNGKL
jgi:hypothetical protein